ncbi:hypothetical protein RRG08_005458 [Elysia crispata]|uniref:Uncharacterized protein n=1 Tax=Elysia crispata TaxID=231223 RepID=A0AAE1CQL9_9GAST|nr:hypothetical protein RRG08_005458 [Elysia crispata]
MIRFVTSYPKPWMVWLISNNRHRIPHRLEPRHVFHGLSQSLPKVFKLVLWAMQIKAAVIVGEDCGLQAYPGHYYQHTQWLPLTPRCRIDDNECDCDTESRGAGRGGINTVETA